MRPNCTSHPLLSILAALAFVGVCSLVLTTAGCSGDDDSGGGAAISDAGGAAADGAGNISDGASSQDASTEDGGSGAGNADATTSADTASPDMTAPDTSSADTGAPDTMVADTGSAADAGGGGTNAELIQCLTQKCSAETSACLGDSDCLKAVGCLGNCKGDATCSLGCGSGLSSAAQQKLFSTMTCATQKGCLGGGGGTGGATCGDGKCDLGEQLTCAKDCPAPVCGDGTCETGEQLTCPKDCGGGGGGTCGDGVCDLGEQVTCAKDCPAPVCGDGKCEAGEQLTCAQDCGGGGTNMSTCIVQKCSSESTACLIDLAGCSQAGVCVVGCTDSACVAKCGDKLTGAAATKFAALRACIDANCITNP